MDSGHEHTQAGAGSEAPQSWHSHCGRRRGRASLRQGTGPPRLRPVGGCARRAQASGRHSKGTGRDLEPDSATGSRRHGRAGVSRPPWPLRAPRGPGHLGQVGVCSAARRGLGTAVSQDGAQPQEGGVSPTLAGTWAGRGGWRSGRARADRDAHSAGELPRGRSECSLGCCEHQPLYFTSFSVCPPDSCPPPAPSGREARPQGGGSGQWSPQGRALLGKV